ncbi:MAG: Rpn family recombination-promoting nuclease/putative transposase [Desulfovermiculus sp.]|nr:Rpn family recombination-promoting nuclease/putative transposase [Desulfovermiculus sp.]
MTFQITNPHDACFKSFFSREEFVRDFIQYYIPEEIKSHLDLSTIEIDMEGYVSEEFKEFYSDVVVLISFVDSDQSLDMYFLFEHKSSPDRFARLQTLNYQVQKWMRMLKNQYLGRRLPIIVPVVIYHGTSSWKYSVDFEEYFRLPSEAFRDFIPKYRHILHDIHSMGDESFKTTTVMEVFHLLLKYIHYPEMDTKLQEIYDLIESLSDEDRAKEYLKIIVPYVLIASPVPTQRVVQHTKRFPGGAEMAGAALQEIREELQQDFDRKAIEYEQRGELKKSREMLLEAVSEKFGTVSPDLVRRINSIESHENLKMLFKQTFRVDSLEEFKEQVNRATDN